MPACWKRPAARIRIEQRDFTPERLAAEIAALAGDPQRLAAHGRAAKSRRHLDAAERLADLVCRWRVCKLDRGLSRRSRPA